MTRQGRHSAPSSGPQAASRVTAVASVQGGGATHQRTETILKTVGLGTFLRQSAIAICIAHVLNSSRAPIASLTSKLTRHERGPNRGPNGRRVCTETRCGTSDGRHRAITPGVSRYGHPQWQAFSTAFGTAWCTAGCARLAARGPRTRRSTFVASGRYGAHRAELCGLAPPRRASLS